MVDIIGENAAPEPNDPIKELLEASKKSNEYLKSISASTLKQFNETQKILELERASLNFARKSYENRVKEMERGEQERLRRREAGSNQPFRREDMLAVFGVNALAHGRVGEFARFVVPAVMEHTSQFVKATTGKNISNLLGLGAFGGVATAGVGALLELLSLGYGGPEKAIGYTMGLGRMSAGTGIGFNSLNRLVQNNAIAQRLGYGPTDIQEYMGKFGVQPRNEEEANLFISEYAMRNRGTSMGLATVAGPAGALIERIMGMGGMTPSQKIQQDRMLGEVMQMAVAKGLNQSEVINSMNENLSIMSKSGPLAKPLESVSALSLGTMGLMGTFGGSGQLARNINAGFQGFTESIGATPMTTLMGLQTFEGIHGQADFVKKFGANAWSQLSPDMQRMVGYLGTPGLNDVARIPIIRSIASSMTATPAGRMAMFNTLQNNPMINSFVNSLAGPNAPLEMKEALAFNALGMGDFTTGMGMAQYSMRGSYMNAGGGDLVKIRQNMNKIGIPAELQYDIISAARRFGVQPEALAAILKHENQGFNPSAVSATGAVGLGQIMPNTMKEFMGKHGNEEVGRTESQKSIDAAAWYASQILNQRHGYDQLEAYYVAGANAKELGPNALNANRDYRNIYNQETAGGDELGINNPAVFGHGFGTSVANAQRAQLGASYNGAQAYLSAGVPVQQAATNAAAALNSLAASLGSLMDTRNNPYMSQMPVTP